MAQKQGHRKPIKHKNKKQADLGAYASQTLGTGNMKRAVQLPKGEKLSEWLAVNTMDLFNEVSMLYGIVSDMCTAESCTVMTAGPRYEYLWMDGVKITKPVKCSAPEYVDYLFTWVEEQINDERIFPVQEGAPFPRNFKQIVKTILKRLFRVYGHIYHSHSDVFKLVDAEAHLNSCFKHFLYFITEFKLVADFEMVPLKDVIASMMAKDEAKFGAAYQPKYKYGADKPAKKG